MKKNSRGLSTIVATLLIILLTIVAIGIIWIVVRNVLQNGAEQVSLGKFTLNLDIKDVAINPAVPNYINVRVKRNAGEGEIYGLKFIIDDGDTVEVVEVNNFSMKELEERMINLTLTDISNASNIKKVSVAPIFRLESGKLVTGDVKDEYEVPKNSATGGTTCTPNCAGKNCGSNGCGGNCGTCSSGTCNSSGQCVASCTPNCAGKNCGSDGCTGTCGTCSSGTCNSSGQCVASDSSWQTGLVAWWKFNGNLLDSIGVNDGTNYGSTFQTTGCVSEQCSIFDGLNDYASVPPSPSINLVGDSFSISVWVNFNNLSDTAADNDDVFVRKTGTNTGYQLRIIDSRILLTFYDTLGTQHYDYETKVWNSSDMNQWWHIVGVYNGTAIIHYRNGVEVDEHVFTNYNLISEQSSLYLGGYNSGAATVLDGTLDEVMIWNRALNSTEISLLYNSFDYGSTPV